MPPRLITSSARTVAQKWVRACASSLILFAAFACLAPSARARDSYARLAWLDVLEYRISLLIPGTSEVISAETTIVFTLKSDAPQELPLDFGPGPLTIEGVTLDGKSAKFRQTDGRLLVALAGAHRRGETLSVVVKYHGHPTDGLFFKQNKFGDHTIFADNWPNRAHHWFPSIDHPYDKAKVEFTVTAPIRYRVVANGRLVYNVERRDGLRLTRWREDVDIPVYCMVFGATEFSVIDAGAFAGTHLSYYLYPKDSDKGVHDYGRALRVAEYFTQLVGPYPYEKLALVESTTRYGGMENSSNIFFDEKAYDGSGKLEGTVAHEIAHQWFGDSVTESDWHDLWLSEGFATYFGALFFEHADGRARFLQIMRDAADRYRKDDESVSRPVHDPSQTDLFKLLNRNNYEKGAWVLHMLRHLMGDEKFFEGIRDYYQTYKGRNADTSDLQRVMEKHYGQRLDWFFHEWIYEPGLPAYEVSWRWFVEPPQTCLRIRQTQPGALFRMPLDVELKTGGGVRRETLDVAAKRNGVTMVFTPFPEWVLKRLHQNPEDAATEYREEIDRLRAGYKLGITIAFGTDAAEDIPNYTRGTQAITWLDSYVAAGLPPQEILKAMTTNAARLLGVEGTQGSIRPGMLADIIATPADPLEDIGALKHVTFVMKYGAVVKDEKK